MTVNALPTSTGVPKENYGTADDGIICQGGTVIFTVPAGFTNYNFLLNGLSVQNGSSPTFNDSDYSIILKTTQSGIIFICWFTEKLIFNNFVYAL